MVGMVLNDIKGETPIYPNRQVMQRQTCTRQGRTSVCYINTSGFLPRVRARARRAPIFQGSLPRQTGRCAPPPAHRSFAASYSTPKNIYDISNLGRPRTGLFSFHWTTEAMKQEVRLSFYFSFSSYSSLLILLFLSLLILLVGAILLLLPFFDPFGLKFMYIPVRSYIPTIFVLFFFINIMSPAPPIAASLILMVLY